MYSRYELEEGFRESKGERAAIAYLKKKEGEKDRRRIVILKTCSLIASAITGTAVVYLFVFV